MIVFSIDRSADKFIDGTRDAGCSFGNVDVFSNFVSGRGYRIFYSKLVFVLLSVRAAAGVLFGLWSQT